MQCPLNGRDVMLRTLLVVASLISIAADWPHWRGPSRNGLTSEASGWANGRWLPEKPTWTAKVGPGASSPLVVGDRVFVFGHMSGSDILTCFDIANGKTLWSASARAPSYGRFHLGDESFYLGPSSTPEYDPATKRIYTLSVDGDLRCRDTAAEGQELWSLNLYDTYKVPQRPKLTPAPRRDYGYTSSPLVHGDWLLVEVGSSRGTLIAFDKTTGKELWASELKDEAGHNGGPTPITVDGVPCVALLTQRHLAVIRLDPDKAGRTVAVFPWLTDFANNIASPAVQDNFVLITSAYNLNAICKVKITLNGADEVWRKRYPSKVCTPIIHEGHVYYAWQKVRCLDWQTGEQRWEGGSFSDPGSCLLTSDDRLVVYGGNGKLALVETAKRSPNAYTELAGRDRIFNTHAWPHVVLANGRLLCRDRDGNIVCFSLTR